MCSVLHQSSRWVWTKTANKRVLKVAIFTLIRAEASVSFHWHYAPPLMIDHVEVLPWGDRSWDSWSVGLRLGWGAFCVCVCCQIPPSLSTLSLTRSSRAQRRIWSLSHWPFGQAMFSIPLSVGQPWIEVGTPPSRAMFIFRHKGEQIAFMLPPITASQTVTQACLHRCMCTLCP